MTMTCSRTQLDIYEAITNSGLQRKNSFGLFVFFLKFSCIQIVWGFLLEKAVLDSLMSEPRIIPLLNQITPNPDNPNLESSQAM